MYSHGPSSKAWSSSPRLTLTTLPEPYLTLHLPQPISLLLLPTFPLFQPFFTSLSLFLFPFRTLCTFFGFSRPLCSFPLPVCLFYVPFYSFSSFFTSSMPLPTLFHSSLLLLCPFLLCLTPLFLFYTPPFSFSPLSASSNPFSVPSHSSSTSSVPRSASLHALSTSPHLSQPPIVHLLLPPGPSLPLLTPASRT